MGIVAAIGRIRQAALSILTCAGHMAVSSQRGTRQGPSLVYSDIHDYVRPGSEAIKVDDPAGQCVTTLKIIVTLHISQGYYGVPSGHTSSNLSLV